MGTTRYIERCPHCEALIYFDVNERQRAFYCTLRECEKCHKSFLDSKWYEWENLNNEEKKWALVFGYAHNLSTEAELRKRILGDAAYSVFLVGIPALVQNKKALAKLQAFRFDPKMLQDKEIQASIKRTSDPEYRKALLGIGREFYGPMYEDR